MLLAFLISALASEGVLHVWRFSRTITGSSNLMVLLIIAGSQGSSPMAPAFSRRMPYHFWAENQEVMLLEGGLDLISSHFNLHRSNSSGPPKGSPKLGHPISHIPMNTCATRYIMGDCSPPLRWVKPPRPTKCLGQVPAAICGRLRTVQD